MCCIFDEVTRKNRDAKVYSPAATGKIVRFAAAMRRHGHKMYVISLGRKRNENSCRFFRSQLVRMSDTPVAYAALLDIAVLTHIVSMVSCAALIVRLRHRVERVVFYNALPHYIPGLLVAKMLHMRCVLDVEDAALRRRDVRTNMQHLCERLFCYLCTGGLMVANRSLARVSPLQASMAFYGIAHPVVCQKDLGYPIRILFSGALLTETGADLFIESLRLFMGSSLSRIGKIKFIVTGFGTRAHDIKVLSESWARGFVEYRGLVSWLEYKELLKECQIGLCLKLPSHEMSETTFPSKVIEMASYGIAVVGFAVSDVPLLFPPGTLVYLRDESPQTLCGIYEDIIRSPQRYRDVGLRGQGVVGEILGEGRVVADVSAFWKCGAWTADGDKII